MTGDDSDVPVFQLGNCGAALVQPQIGHDRFGIVPVAREALRDDRADVAVEFDLSSRRFLLRLGPLGRTPDPGGENAESGQKQSASHKPPLPRPFSPLSHHLLGYTPTTFEASPLVRIE